MDSTKDKRITYNNIPFDLFFYDALRLIKKSVPVQDDDECYHYQVMLADLTFLWKYTFLNIPLSFNVFVTILSNV